MPENSEKLNIFLQLPGYSWEPEAARFQKMLNKALIHSECCTAVRVYVQSSCRFALRSCLKAALKMEAVPLSDRVFFKEDLKAFKSLAEAASEVFFFYDSSEESTDQYVF